MSTVLLVDSDVDCRHIFRSALAHDGYRVLEAADGDEAVRMIAENDVRLVLGELYVRTHQGDLLLPTLKAHSHAGKLSVIVVSTQGFDDARTEALAAGADAYFVKPCELLTMRDAVRRAIGQAPGSRLDPPGHPELWLV